jgi:hypothetical protein
MLTASQGFLFEDWKQNQWEYKERQGKHPEEEVIHKLLIVKDPAGVENEQVLHDGCTQNVRMQSTPRVN